MRLEHVNLTVSDLDRSLEFYRRLLGLRIRWRGRLSSGLEGAHVGDDDMYLALFQASAPGRVDNDYAGVGLNHFGFVVDDLDGHKRGCIPYRVAPLNKYSYSSCVLRQRGECRVRCTRR